MKAGFCGPTANVRTWPRQQLGHVLSSHAASSIKSFRRRGLPSRSTPDGHAVIRTAKSCIRLMHLTGRASNAMVPLVYLSGTDGTGQSITTQLRGLTEQGYDVWSLCIPPSDRSGWDTLTSTTVSLLQQLSASWQPPSDSPSPPQPPSSHADPTSQSDHASTSGVAIAARPAIAGVAVTASSAPSQCRVLLLGESFGGALALRVALASADLLTGVVLLNPGTSFNRSLSGVSSLVSSTNLLSFFPAAMYNTAQATLLPLLLDSERVGAEGLMLMKAMILMEPVMGKAAETPPLGGRPPAVLHSPAAAANFRVNLLRSGDIPNKSLAKVKVPTLVLCSARDRLLPSLEEGARLVKAIPGSKRVILPDSCHAALLEKDLDLSKLLLRASFDPASLALRPARGTASSTPTSSSSSNGSNGNGTASSSQSPLPGGGGGGGGRKRVASTAGGGYSQGQAWDLWTQRLAAWRDLISPVVIGFDNLPIEGHPDFDRPMLFVGNHGKMGFYDTPLLMYELYIRGYRIRPIAHPGHWTPPNPFGPFIETLGAVKASPLAAFRLLKNKEKVLLFPGGAREVVKKRDESYQLLWKDTPDFVRMATKCNALIVPFAAVGADDAYDVIMETEEQVDHPFFGPIIKELLYKKDSPFDLKEAVFPLTRMPVLGLPTPLPVPNLTRLYFKFGKPIDGSALGVDVKNEEQCQALYDDVKASVLLQIQDLLAVRAEDDQVTVTSRLQRTVSQFIPMWQQGQHPEP